MYDGWIMSTCQHKAVFLFWDEDEVKCRVCSQSLTFPARRPTAVDDTERKRDLRLAGGEKHRSNYALVEQGIEDEDVEVGEEVVEVAPLLTCRCCREVLPSDRFAGM